jgi:hypothetical protein
MYSCTRHLGAEEKLPDQSKQSSRDRLVSLRLGHVGFGVVMGMADGPHGDRLPSVQIGEEVVTLQSARSKLITFAIFSIDRGTLQQAQWSESVSGLIAVRIGDFSRPTRVPISRFAVVHIGALPRISSRAHFCGAYKCRVRRYLNSIGFATSTLSLYSSSDSSTTSGRTATMYIIDPAAKSSMGMLRFGQ